MSKIRVAIRVPVGRPLPDIAAFVARCEAAGFDGVGIHDHPSSGRDAYLALALAAQSTQSVKLFPATSSPMVRHPLVLASLAHSLEEIAPGRTFSPWPPGSFPRGVSAHPAPRYIHARRDPRSSPVSRRGRSCVRTNADAPPEPKRDADTGLSARCRSSHDRTRGRSGRWCVSLCRPASRGDSRRVAPSGGRCQASRAVARRFPGGVCGHPWSRDRYRGGRAVGS